MTTDDIIGYIIKNGVFWEDWSDETLHALDELKSLGLIKSCAADLPKFMNSGYAWVDVAKKPIVVTRGRDSRIAVKD